MYGFGAYAELPYAGLQDGAASTPGGVVLLGGGPGDEHHHGHFPSYAELREKEYQRKLVGERHRELRAVENDLSGAEALHKEALAQDGRKRRAKKAAKELAKLQEEINRLRIQRAWLMRLIDDEEAILILLLSMPFVQ